MHLWAAAVRKAGSTSPALVRAAGRGLSYEAPSGRVTIDAANQHLWKVARIGVVEGSGQIREIWSSGAAVAPDPYLEAWQWARPLA